MSEPEDERAVLEVVELSESEDDFDYKVVEVRFTLILRDVPLPSHQSFGRNTKR